MGIRAINLSCQLSTFVMKKMSNKRISPTSLQDGVIGRLPSQVWMISFGEPTLFNVIGYDEETDQYQIQSPGHYGSRYRKRSDAMTLNDIELWVFENAAAEVNRLQKLKIELEIYSRSK